jgi:hypothetical protein
MAIRAHDAVADRPGVVSKIAEIYVRHAKG